MKEFHTYTVYIGNEVNDSSGRSHLAWIVPAWFNRLWFIYGPLHFQCDRTLQAVRYSNRSEINIKLVQKLIPESFSALKQQGYNIY